MLKKLRHVLRDHPQLFIQPYFIIITILFGMAFMLSDKLRFGDLFFNYFRMKEAGLDLLHGQFPQFSWFTGTILGGATNTFYPWLTSLPFLPLMHFLTPIHWWTFLVSAGFLMGLEVAYRTSRTVHWDRGSAFIFANFYVLSLIAVDYIYFGNDVGSFYSMLLAPLVFFGWWHWLHDGRWRMMTAGMLLIGFTHLVTVLILGAMLALLTITFYRQLTRGKLINLIKAITIFVSGTAIIWIPILFISLSNQIYTPSAMPMAFLQRPLFIKPISAYLFALYGDNFFSLADIIAILLMIMNWRHASATDKKFTGVGLIFMIINCQPIARWLVNNTLFSNLQFMHRFSFCSHLLLTVVLIDLIRHFVQNRGWHQLYLPVTIIMGFMIIMMLAAGRLYVNENQQKPTISIDRPTDAIPQPSNRGSSVVDQRTMSKLIFWHVLMNTYSDYYPSYYVKISTINHAKAPRIKIPMLEHTGYTSTGQLIENVPHDRTYMLPMVTYHQQNYRLTVNGQAQPLRAKHHYVQAKLHRGRNVIQLTAPLMWYRYLAIIVSLIGIYAICHPRRRGRRFE